MNKLLLLAGVMLAGVLVAACGGDDDDDETIRIGALLPLSGALQSYGEASRAALEMARDAINEDADKDVELVIRDTATDGDTALAMLRELHEEGIKVIIGPYGSGEVTAVKAFADENRLVLISPLSTAGTLAVPDTIFRYTPDETAEGEAVAAVALEDGITTVIPVSRDDPGNLGLQNGMRAAFEPEGGTIAEGVIYGGNEDDFEGVVEDIIAALEAAGSSPAETAVYLTAYEEVEDLMGAAADMDSDVLRSVIWYGSDSVALSARLIQNADAAGFAVSVGYPNPILGLRDEDEAAWQPVVDALQSELGRRPDTFALAAYDALFVAHRTILAVGANADGNAIGAEFVSQSGDYVGLTGPTALNAAGDRSSASFDFWSVCPEGNSFTWVRTISYAVSEDGTGEVIRSEC